MFFNFPKVKFVKAFDFQNDTADNLLIETSIYRAFHKLPQIYAANYATFPIKMYAITV